MTSEVEKTPCGRIPNTPLRNRKHEIIVHATVQGKTARDAGLEAGYKDGPGLDGNVTRILHRPEVKERLEEVAAHCANIPAVSCGRIPNTPLRNPQHEIIVHAMVQGKNARDAGLEAGYKDGPGLDGNVTRILHRPEVKERLEEVAAHCTNLAGIYDAWVLLDIKRFAKGSIARFWKRDSDGNLVLDKRGHPSIDFSNASEEELRCISEFTYNKYGPKLKIHDPKGFLEMLGRHRGLFKDQMPAPAFVNAPIEIRLVKPESSE